MKKSKTFWILCIVLIMCSNCTNQNKKTSGFEEFELKDAIIPSFIEKTQTNLEPNVNVTIDFKDTINRVSKFIYGNNANIYMTQMVDQPQLLEYIRDLSPNILRFPGGNLSNMYFWDKQKGDRPTDIPNPLYGATEEKYEEEVWYGKNDSSNTISIDNYYKMLEMTNSTGIISVNFGYSRYGTSKDPVAQAAHYAANWVKYDNGRTKFWEIGNENYGPWIAGFLIDTNQNKEGQPEKINGTLYAKHFLVFADSMRAAAKKIGSEIKIGAVTIEKKKGPGYYNPIEETWNEEVFNTIGNFVDFFVVHSYFTPYRKNSKPDEIIESAGTETSEIMEYIHSMCKEYNIEVKPVALTEWNIFAIKFKQQTSYINGIHTALVLGNLIKNRYGLAMRWNLANSWAKGDDHGMFSQGGEPGIPRFTPRPVFFYMYYFQKYFGDHMVKSISDNEKIEIFSSRFNSGEAGLILFNKSKVNQVVKINLENFKHGNRYYYYTLVGGEDNNEFSLQVFVNDNGPVLPIGGPENYKNIKANSSQIKGDIIFECPKYSVQYILIENKKQ